jgi:adenylate kinase family enzyme
MPTPESGVDVLVPTLAEKRLIAFGGISGCGKTTQLLALGGFLGASVFHVGRFARTLTLPADVVRRHEWQRSQGLLMDGITDLFLDAIDRAPESTVILDGFPRDPDEARALLAAAAAHWWHITLIHLELDPHDPERASRTRQIERYRQAHEVAPDADAMTRIEGKVRRYAAEELPALSVLADAGIPVCHISAGSVEEVSRAVFDAVAPFPAGLALDLPRLELVQRALGCLQIPECYAVSGAFCRAFWNDRFGPPTLPLDLDIVCTSAADADVLGRHLRATHPELRLAITDLPTATRAKYGRHETDFLTARRLNPMRWRQGGLRITPDAVAVVATAGTLYDLRTGTLRLDEQVMADIPASHRDAVLDEAVFRARKALAEYPKLTVVGTLAERMPATVTTIARPEYEQKGDFQWSVGLTEAEAAAARALRTVVHSLAPSMSPVPVPARAVLPEPLGTIQRQKEHGLLGNVPTVLPPPNGYATWMHFVAYQCDDAQFREWLLMQSRSRNPIGGKDPFVELVLSDEYLPAEGRDRWSAKGWPTGTQRGTHGGVRVGQHHLTAALCLSTEGTTRVAVEHGLPAEAVAELRAGLRVGMFCHDLGKLPGPQVTLGAGFHENAGAALWNRHLRPAWAADGLSATVVWCIRNHSLLGRLTRAIDEKADGPGEDVTAVPSYTGAVDPAFVRSRLALLGVPFEVALTACVDIQRADIASIPSLRYLLPTVEGAAGVVRAGRG